MIALRLFAIALLFTVTACASNSLQHSEIGFRRDASDVANTPHANVRWHVLLAATGNEEGVFDRFVSDFATRLQGRADIAQVRRLSAARAPGTQPSNMAGLRSNMQALRPAAGEGCLIYLTGHGTPEGLVMSAHDPKVLMPPDVLQRMLTPCSGRPTVVVVSACYSGIFMRPGIASVERIVLTASDADSPSFGCSDNRTYTFFDQCFLDAWPGNARWETLSDDVIACVRRTEAAMEPAVEPSSPQAFFGRQMRALPLPARAGNQLITPGDTAWNFPSR